jgi:hypothetical protein
VVSERCASYETLLGLELRNEIERSRHSIRSVARALGKDNGVFLNYLSASRSIPSIIVIGACEVIGIDPCEVFKNAYAKLCADKKYGPPPPPQEPTGRRGRPPKAAK